MNKPAVIVLGLSILMILGSIIIFLQSDEMIDGFVEDKTLFSIDEAVSRGTIIKYLLSDTAQISEWAKVKDNLNPHDTLYFSHGFGIHYHKYTNINPPEDINIIMVELLNVSFLLILIDRRYDSIHSL